MSISDYRKKLDGLRTQYLVACRSYDQDRKARIEMSRRHKATIQAQKILQEIAQKLQETAHKNIATIVSECLAAVFDDPYKFKIRFEQKRGKTEAFLGFERDGHLVSPTKGAGGGVLDVASFALRLSSILLARPGLRKILVLDEPFKMLSANHVIRVREMLDRLASELGVQFLIVTHIKELRGSTAYILENGKVKKWE